MIRRLFALSPLATLLALLTAHAFRADVASVQCTIKSVDPTTRSITVAYMVGTAEKSITLDVSRKAEITLNGEKADLGALGPGMKATVEYDRALEIVTKIQSTGSRLMMDRMVYRLTLSLSEFGDGKFRLRKHRTRQLTISQARLSRCLVCHVPKQQRARMEWFDLFTISLIQTT